MGKKIYAFVVGINDYPDPRDRLSGAVPDTGKIVQYLTDNIPAPQLFIKTLINGEATYQNFISGFREHLGKAGKDDVVWFHYSGHGSRQATAPELRPFTSGNMDETLVLVDSRPNGKDLADKELGVLLSEVEQSGAHILVSLDCCHSGSGTRSVDDPAVQFKTRLAGDRNDSRTLDSYMDGYFVKNGLNFPDPKHILLAACNRFQTAKEDFNSSGVFTANLMNILKKAGTDISYADLFVRLRQGVIAGKTADQDPQIELMGGSDGYVRFLDGSPAGGLKKFPVFMEQGKWIMGAGAIQGFQDAAEKKIELNIYTDDGTEPLTTAVITSVNFQKAGLAPKAQLEPKTKYWAIPNSFPAPPEKIFFEGSAENFTSFTNELKNFPQLTAATATEKELAGMNIKVTEDVYELWEKERQLLIATADKTDVTGAQKLLLLANQVVTWKRIYSLQNLKTKIEPTDTTIRLEITPTDKPTVSYSPGKVNLDNTGERYPYRIMIRNLMEQPLNYCLLYLSENYGVKVMKNDSLEPLDTPAVFWGGREKDNFFNKGKTATNDTFLLIVSTERTNDFELQANGIKLGASVSGPATRGVAGIDDYEPLKGEWFTCKFNVQIG